MEPAVPRRPSRRHAQYAIWLVQIITQKAQTKAPCKMSITEHSIHCLRNSGASAACLGCMDCSLLGAERTREIEFAWRWAACEYTEWYPPGNRLAAIGIGLDCRALFVSRILASLLFGSAARFAYLSGVSILLFCALAALHPREERGVDPMIALRYDDC